MNLVAQGTGRPRARTRIPVLSVPGGLCLRACGSMDEVIIWLTGNGMGFVLGKKGGRHSVGGCPGGRAEVMPSGSGL